MPPVTFRRNSVVGCVIAQDFDAQIEFGVDFVSLGCQEEENGRWQFFRRP